MENKKSEELIKNLDIAFVIVNKDKKIVYANDIARKKLFHNNPDLFYEKDVKNFHSRRARKKIQRIYSLARKERFKGPLFVKLIDTSKGTTVYLVKISELIDKKNKFAGFVAAFFDVTSLTVNKLTNEINKIPVKSRNRIIFIDIDKIVNIRAEKGKVCIFDKDGREFVSNLSLEEIEKRFEDKGIFRVHRCCLVNLKYIKSIVTDKKCHHMIKFVIDSAPLVPISRRKYLKLKKLFPFGFR